MYKHHTRLELVEGGNIFKQGDHPTLKFIGYDSLGNEVDLTGKQIEGALFSRNKGIIYEASGSFADGRIIFTIDELLDHGKFQLEFTVTDSADPDYRVKFPSDEFAAQLTIKPSKDNMDFFGVSLTTVAQLRTEQEAKQQQFEQQIVPQFELVKNQFNEVLNGVTEDGEVLAAHIGPEGTFDTIGQRMDNTAAQLAEKARDSETHRKMPLWMLAKVSKKIDFPIGWTWTDAPINIFQLGDGTITTDFDASAYEPPAGKTYYLSMTGHADNDGLTLETAKSSLNRIFQMGDADTILVDEGYYDFNRGTNQTDMSRNIAIKALPGKDVTISTEAFLSYTKTSGYTNVYQTSRSVVAKVFDGYVLNEDGDYTLLKQKASIAECDAEPGSFYYSSPTLYVHPLSSRVPDADLHVFLSLYNLRTSGNYLTYTEGIKWYGGNNGAAYVSTSATGQNPLFVAKDCEFKYSSDGNGGLTILGADAYLEKSIASSNFRDGLNYHISHGRVNKVIEVDCEGFRNGIGRGTETDNGSTMHDGGKIIRVNGEYFGNEGPNVHDVTAGTESWNIGVDSHDSVSNVDARNNNYQIENGKMWLDTCIGYGSYRAYGVPNGEFNLRNCLFDDGVRSVTGGILNNY